ncbi:MAG: HAD family phosphatase [Aggregatilineales bacterium]
MTTKPTFQAIIFDMDGLLVDSEKVWQIAEEQLIAVRGRVYTDDVREQIIGLRLDEFMQKIKDIYQFEESLEALVEDLNTRMMDLIPKEVNAQPGAQEMIEYVRAQDIPCAIASSSPMSIIDATIGAMGWDTSFANRFSADDDARGKPAPDVYLRAVKTLGFDPAECLALEDSPNGSRAAVAAGMTCYAVPDPTHSTPDKFEGITPHVFSSLHEVLAKLKG